MEGLPGRSPTTGCCWCCAAGARVLHTAMGQSGAGLRIGREWAQPRRALDCRGGLLPRGCGSCCCGCCRCCCCGKEQAAKEGAGAPELWWCCCARSWRPRRRRGDGQGVVVGLPEGCARRGGDPAAMAAWGGCCAGCAPARRGEELGAGANLTGDEREVLQWCVRARAGRRCCSAWGRWGRQLSGVGG